jgi:Zn-dependent protease
VRFLMKWPLAVSVTSVAVFASAFSLILGWPQVLALTAFLVGHEAGHVAVLRLLGLRTRWIVFLPFAGAITAHDSYPPDSAYRRMVVALGGLGLGLAVVPFLLLAGQAQVAGWALGLTAFNLIPVRPLDGGHIYDWASTVRPYPYLFRAALLSWASVGLLQLLAV